MLVIKILSGRAAGRVISASRFPFSIGRAPEASLSCQDEGVWDRHAQIELDPINGFAIRVLGEASVLIQGQPIRTAHLRNGETLRLGALEISCWLSPPLQKNLHFQELIVWGTIFALLVGQLLLIYRLISVE